MVTGMHEQRERIVSIYGEYLSAVNERRLDDLEVLVAEDVRGSVAGRDAYIAGLRMMIAGFDDCRWDVDQLLVDGDRLAVQLTGTGTHTGSFRGIAASGRSISAKDMAFYRVSGGRIVEAWGDLGAVVLDALLNAGGSGGAQLPPQHDPLDRAETARTSGP